eukprot:CFRG1823T1
MGTKKSSKGGKHTKPSPYSPDKPAENTSNLEVPTTEENANDTPVENILFVDAVKELTPEDVEGKNVDSMLQALNTFFYGRNVNVGNLSFSTPERENYMCINEPVQKIFEKVYQEADEAAVANEFLRAMNSAAQECRSGKYTPRSASNRLIVQAIGYHRPSALLGKPLEYALKQATDFKNSPSDVLCVMWCLSQSNNIPISISLWCKYTMKSLLVVGEITVCGKFALKVLEWVTSDPLSPINGQTTKSLNTDSVEIVKTVNAYIQALDIARSKSAEKHTVHNGKCIRYHSLVRDLKPLFRHWVSFLSSSQVRTSRFNELVSSLPVNKPGTDVDVHFEVLEEMFSNYPKQLCAPWAKNYCNHMIVKKGRVVSRDPTNKTVTGAIRLVQMVDTEGLPVDGPEFTSALGSMIDENDQLLKYATSETLETLNTAQAVFQSAIEKPNSKSSQKHHSSGGSCCSKLIIVVVTVIALIAFALQSNNHCKMYPCVNEGEENDSCHKYSPCTYITRYQLEPYLTQTEEGIAVARSTINEQLADIKPHADKAYDWANENVMAPVDETIIKPLRPVVDEYAGTIKQMYNEHVHPTLENAYTGAVPVVYQFIAWTEDTAYPQAEEFSRVIVEKTGDLSQATYENSLVALEVAQKYSEIATEEALKHGSYLYKEGYRISSDTAQYIDKNVIKEIPVYTRKSKEWARVNVLKKASPFVRRNLKCVRKWISNALTLTEGKLEAMIAPTIVKFAYDLSDKSGLSDRALYSPIMVLVGNVAGYVKGINDEYIIPNIYYEETTPKTPEAEAIEETIASTVRDPESDIDEVVPDTTEVEAVEPVEEVDGSVKSVVQGDEVAVDRGSVDDTLAPVTDSVYRAAEVANERGEDIVEPVVNVGEAAEVVNKSVENGIETVSQVLEDDMAEYAEQFKRSVDVSELVSKDEADRKQEDLQNMDASKGKTLERKLHRDHNDDKESDEGLIESEGQDEARSETLELEERELETHEIAARDAKERLESDQSELEAAKRDTRETPVAEKMEREDRAREQRKLEAREIAARDAKERAECDQRELEAAERETREAEVAEHMEREDRAREQRELEARKIAARDAKEREESDQRELEAAEREAREAEVAEQIEREERAREQERSEREELERMEKEAREQEIKEKAEKERLAKEAAAKKLAAIEMKAKKIAAEKVQKHMEEKQQAAKELAKEKVEAMQSVTAKQ